MGGDLGIQTGEYWAYRSGTTHPPVRALILNPGQHYDANIRIRLVDDPAVVELWTTRTKLPCKWSKLEVYLLEHPDVPRLPADSRARRATRPRRGQDGDHTANELRSIIHDEVTNALGAQKIAYTLQGAAITTGVSTTLIRAAVPRNDLVASYAGTKPLLLRKH